MPFDPDKYLAAKSFDPDTYLAKKAEDAPSPLKSFVRQGVNAMSLGYLPEITGAAAKVVYPAYEKITGQSVPDELKDYTNVRDSEYRELAKDLKTNPKASIGGTIGGALALAIPTAGRSMVQPATVSGRIAQAAKSGALFGAIANPGAKEGEIAPIQAVERAENALLGATIGAALQGGAETLKGLPNIPKRLSSYAEEKAFKTTGAKLKDTQKAFTKGRLLPMGRAMLDEEIVTPGSTPKSILTAVEEKTSSLGKEISKVIDAADDAGRSVNVGEVASEARSAMGVSEMAKTPGLEGAASKIESYLSTMLSRGKSVTQKVPSASSIDGFVEVVTKDPNIGVREAWTLRRGIDRALKRAYRNKTFDEFPEAETALLKLRSIIQDKIEAQADESLKPMLRRYSLLADVRAITQKETARNMANRSISLTDTIAGAAGAIVKSAGGSGVGGALGYAAGGEEGALAGAAMGALGNKAMRTYGPSIVASAANKAAKILGASEKEVRPIAQSLFSTYMKYPEGLRSGSTLLAIEPKLQSIPGRLKDVAVESEEMKALKRRQQNRR